MLPSINVQCLACGTLNDEDATACTLCGFGFAPQEPQWRCPNFHQNDARAVFCLQCGKQNPATIPPPPREPLRTITLSPKRVRIQVGEEVTIQCHATEDGRAASIADISWYLPERACVEVVSTTPDYATVKCTKDDCAFDIVASCKGAHDRAEVICALKPVVPIAPTENEEKHAKSFFEVVRDFLRGS